MKQQKDFDIVAKVFVIVVTHNRPALLSRCLAALAGQDRPADAMIVVDNASDHALDWVVLAHRQARILRLGHNQGPAAGFAAGIRAALAGGATHVWLMDDDGAPAEASCLKRLLQTAVREDSALTCPLVRNVASPERLAFPIRQRRRTRFTAAELDPGRLIEGFAHLFNGTLITAGALAVTGLPDARLFMRGDEVEFLLRSRRAGLRVVTDTDAAFLHPACDAEIHPILGGTFYAMVPNDALKRRCQFRNRGWIFARYGLWGWLAADHIRYACHFGSRRDVGGYARWLRATWAGVLGMIGDPRQVAVTARHGGKTLLERAS